MRIFKAAAWIAVIAAVVIVVNCVLDHILVPNQYARVKVHEIETETYQDLILGTSHGASAFDPSVMTEITGRTTYNAAMGGEYLRDSLYMLKDAVASGHAPERVIYECDPTYFCIDNDMSENESYLFSVVRPSLVKAEYYFDVMWAEDFRWSFFRWSYYLDYADRIGETVAEKASDDYKNYGVSCFAGETQALHEDGFNAIFDDSPAGTTIPKTYTAEDELLDENLDELRELAGYCAAQGIELIVVTTPIPAETAAGSETFFNYANDEISALCAELGVSYLNYNFIESGLDRSIEAYSDLEGHMRESAAAAFSALFASEL